jgi:hypothetical protein
MTVWKAGRNLRFSHLQVRGYDIVICRNCV